MKVHTFEGHTPKQVVDTILARKKKLLNTYYKNSWWIADATLGYTLEGKHVVVISLRRGEWQRCEPKDISIREYELYQNI